MLTALRVMKVLRVLPIDAAAPEALTTPRTPGASGSAAQIADILALGRAALDAIGRALRSSPEVRANRVMARWPLDLEDLLLELEPIQAETPITELAARLGVSTAQLRSTALRLQRLALVRVSSAGVALTAGGRQKLARLEMARAAVLRRIARGLDMLDTDRSKVVLGALGVLIDQAERVVEEQLGQRPKVERRPPPPRGRSSVGGSAGSAPAGSGGLSPGSAGGARAAAGGSGAASPAGASGGSRAASGGSANASPRASGASAPEGGSGPEGGTP